MTKSSLIHKPLNDTRKDDLITLTKALGNKEGNGLNAKPDLAEAVLNAAADGVIGTENATEIWTEYASAMRRTVGQEHTRLSEKGDKVRISELKRFIMVGAMPAVNPVELFGRAIGIIHDHEVKGSTYQNLVTVMRKQCEIADHGLTDDEIMEVLFPAAPEKDEKARLEAILKSMKRTHDGAKGDPDKGIPPQAGFPSEELAEAIVQIEARLATFAKRERVAQMLKAAAEDGYEFAPETAKAMNEIIGVATEIETPAA